VHEIMRKDAPRERHGLQLAMLLALPCAVRAAVTADAA
jgi:hypothetical protein